MLCRPAAQLGVRVPSSAPGFFSIREVQRITLAYTPRAHAQLLRVMYRRSADAGTDVVLRVAPSVTAAAAAVDGSDAVPAAGGPAGPLAVLNDPRIGARLLAGLPAELRAQPCWRLLHASPALLTVRALH